MKHHLVLAVLAAFLASSGAINRHVGCYFASWAYTRPGMGVFWPEDIDPNLCDVVYYGFANILNDTYEVCSWDPWFDMDMAHDANKHTIKNCIRHRDGADWPTGCYTTSGQEYCHHNGIRRTVALKSQNPDFKVLLSVGGYSAGGKPFSDMCKTAQTRRSFIDSVVEFLDYFGLDGMDLDWEFPGLDMVTGELTDPNDREHYTELIRELRTAFDSHNPPFLLTMASTPDPYKAAMAYELEKISPLFDWINVMTYDYGGSWDGYTGIDAPVFGKWEESFEGHPHYDFNMFATIDHYLNNGAPANKLVMGIHTEAKGFVLDNPGDNGIYCLSSASPNMTFSRQEGWLYYYEVLQFFFNSTIQDPLWSDLRPGLENWEILTDGCYKAPYATQGRYWISWDDPIAIDLKIRFANQMGLYGAFVWEVDADNFMGLFNRREFEILNTIRDSLAAGQHLTNDEMLGAAADNRGACRPEVPMCDFTFSTTPRTGSSTPRSTTAMSDSSPDPSPTTAMSGSTTTGDISDCNAHNCVYHNQNVAYPGNCHWYLKCLYDGNGNCYMDGPHDCMDYIFDPESLACVPPELLADENLC